MMIAIPGNEVIILKQQNKEAMQQTQMRVSATTAKMHMARYSDCGLTGLTGDGAAGHTQFLIVVPPDWKQFTTASGHLATQSASYTPLYLELGHSTFL